MMADMDTTVAEFIRALPADVLLPEVRTGDDDEIYLAWDRDAEWLHIRFALGSRLVEYVWFGRVRQHLVLHADFDGTVPHEVVGAIRQMGRADD